MPNTASAERPTTTPSLLSNRCNDQQAISMSSININPHEDTPKFAPNEHTVEQSSLIKDHIFASLSVACETPNIPELLIVEPQMKPVRYSVCASSSESDHTTLSTGSVECDVPRVQESVTIPPFAKPTGFTPEKISSSSVEAIVTSQSTASNMEPKSLPYSTHLSKKMKPRRILSPVEQDIADLKRMMSTQDYQISELRAENVEIRAENSEMRAENADLRAQAINAQIDFNLRLETQELQVQVLGARVAELTEETAALQGWKIQGERRLVEIEQNHAMVAAAEEILRSWRKASW
ncbi:hypothetical protein BCR33DRAFT_858504 [Rhizoclosmatium globosum]|uniref:Autophagy-related protein 16 domain-containing protein n=1 Tax=Rhizoclosmatium globosum TaxID=329046 RepID=A0A1Y2AXF8_9FUNG|nr:hypothetical protein BCR33DRAFT_858504 [Rhizoclosmatium globosum]|eukprot:ORY27273.1 hypothetical protein BCR33DRAFT_858504 [Rhizoclosmatium globosum]